MLILTMVLIGFSVLVAFMLHLDGMLSLGRSTADPNDPFGAVLSTSSDALEADRQRLAAHVADALGNWQSWGLSGQSTAPQNMDAIRNVRSVLNRPGQLTTDGLIRLHAALSQTGPIYSLGDIRVLLGLLTPWTAEEWHRFRPLHYYPEDIQDVSNQEPISENLF